MTMKFVIADHVVCRKTNSELRMLFDRDKGVMYEMNETASAVIELLSQEPASTEELAQALEQYFDGPSGEIKDDIERLLADFTDAGLVRGTDQS
jgi:PqqD family protein of HPr-rel-A system